MASTLAIPWQKAFLDGLARDLDRTFVPQSTGVGFLVELANSLAANDVLPSRAEAQEWVESLAADVDTLHVSAYAGTFANNLADVEFSALPFVYTP